MKAAPRPQPARPAGRAKALARRPGVALEHQADERARRYLRGEQGLAAGLGRAPAAARPALAAASVGQGLAPGLRRSLEEAFGADLRWLQVHDDVAAHRLAAGHGARAMAVGIDIYFAAGAFAPQQASGRELLAHEVTHVLQQTARRSHGGRWLAAPVAGTSAPPQYKLDYASLRKLHGQADKSAAYTEAADALKPLANNGAKLAAHAEAQWEKLDAWTDASLSLLYDLLKTSGQTELAVRLIERDAFKTGKRLKTGGYDQAVVDLLISRSSGTFVFQRAVEMLPGLKLYRDEWLRLVEGFLLSASDTRPVPLMRNADPAAGAKSTQWQGIADHEQALRSAYAAATEPLNTEWFYRGLLHLLQLDGLRVRMAQSARDQRLSRGYEEARRRHRLDHVRKMAGAVRNFSYTDAAYTQAWQPFNEKMAQAVEALADKVEAQWGRLDALRAQWRDPKTNGPPDAKLVAAIVALATSSGLSTELVGLIKALNASGPKGVRIPPDYPDLCDRRAAALEKRLHQQIDAKLPLWHRTGKSDKVVAGLWLISALDEISEWVRRNRRPFGSPPTATAMVTVSMGMDVPQVMAHRIEIARRLAALAPTLGSTELAEQAKVVMEARLESESLLVLLPDNSGQIWSRSDISKERLLRDFSDEPLISDEPITPYAMLLLYEADYLQRLGQELQRALPRDEAGEKKAVAMGAVPGIVGSASKAARADQERRGMTPQRWSVAEDGRHVYSAEKAGGKNFADLLDAKIKAEPFHASASGLGLRMVMPLQDHGRAFVWYWPSDPTVFTLLRRVPLYRSLVAQQAFKARDTQALQREAQLELATWRRHLGEVVKVQLDPRSKAGLRLKSGELADLSKQIRAVFQQLVDERESALGPALQQATRIDRMRLAQAGIGLLNLYQQESLRSDYRDDAFERMQRFYLQLLVIFRGEAKLNSEDDSDLSIALAATSRPRLHLGALLLEMAPTLLEVLQRERSGPFIQNQLGMLEDGLEAAQALLGLSDATQADYLHSDERAAAWSGARLEALKQLVAALQEQRHSVQMRAGYKARAKERELKVALSFSSPIQVGTVLRPRTGYGVLGSELTGKFYMLVDVKRDFIYHPAFGTEYAQTMKNLRSGYGAPMLLQMDDSTPLADLDQPLLEVVETTAKGEIIGKPFSVSGQAKDYPMLAQIYSGALYEAFGNSMENIQKGIELYVSTLADLAELIPGWGQAITAARVVATIGEFWASGSFEEMLGLIKGDTWALINALIDKFGEVAKPGPMVEMLLFGNETLNQALSSSTLTAATKTDAKESIKPATSKGKFAAIKKTFRALRGLGRWFALRMSSLHERVQQPMQDARIYTSTRPVLSTVLHFGAEHIYEIEALMRKGAAILAMLEEGDQKKVSARDELTRDLGDQQRELGAKIHAIVGRLATLELPAEIFDATGAIQAVLAEMMAFIGKRLGIKGKAVVIVLQGSGALDYCAGKVASEIIARGYDPNVYWREEIVPRIADTFTEARDGLVAELNALLAKPAFAQAFSPINKGDKIGLQTDPDDTGPTDDGMQPSPAEDRRLQPRPERLPAIGAGRALAPAQRQPLQQAFGSDLSHVRVHGDSEGEAMTAAFGAEALASGSHVFLRQGLNPQRGRGEQVLHHELAHVVQQTGRRPRRGDEALAPVPARPDKGLVLDGAGEQQADRMAAQVRRQLGGAGMAAPAAGKAAAAVQGMQPYTEGTIEPHLLARGLNTLNSLPAIAAAEAQLDKHQAAAKLDRSDDTKAVKAVVDALTKVTHKNSALTVKVPKVYSGPVDVNKPSGDRTVDKILAELGKSLDASHFQVVASHIAREAQDTLPTPAVTGVKGAKAKKSHWVKPSHFARQLESYILGKTGVALALELKTRDFTAPDGKTLHEIDPDDPLKSVAVLHLFLPYIASNSDLAVKAITNTWPDTLNDDKKRASVAAVVRGHLSGRGIRAAVWALFGDKYVFSLLFKREIDQIMSAKLTAGGALDPNSLPPPAEYANDGKGGKVAHHIGTRVATYADANQTAPGRHSHHLTQFLVGEYFANQNNGKQPFLKDAAIPGVVWNTDHEVEAIQPTASATAAAGTGTGIRAAETWGGSSRGGKMPAISLAAPTHTGGSLHITPQPDDLGKAGKSTQAYAVDSTFRNHLPAALKKENFKKDFPKWRKTQSDDDIAKTVYDAATQTYRYWAGHMNNMLKANMPRLELEYYKTLAAAHTTHPEITAVATDSTRQAALLKDLNGIAGIAVQHNLDTMETLGWKAR